MARVRALRLPGRLTHAGQCVALLFNYNLERVVISSQCWRDEH